MRTRLACALAALLVPAAALVGALGSSTAAQAADSNGGYRIMPLGDSITYGIGAAGSYRTSLWQKFTAAGAKVDFVGSVSDTAAPASLGDRDNEGHSGWTVQQILDNVTQWQRTYQPQTILLHIGTNDMYGSDPNGAPQRLATLVDRIVANNPNVYLYVSSIIPLGFGTSNNQVLAFNAKVPGIVAAKAATGAKVFFADMYPALTTSDLADGVHPNAGGYDKMAAVWWSAMQKVPASYGAGSPTTTTTTTAPTTTTTTRTSTTTTTSTPTRTTTSSTSKKPVKIKTVKKCRTGKNGKKTCRTTIKTVKPKAACSASVSGLNAWPGGSAGTVTVEANGPWSLVLPDGVTSPGAISRRVRGAGPAALVVVGASVPGALPLTCS